MNSISWRLVEILSRALDADEREAVRGDIEESGQTGAKALRDVAGLVIRRQAALWRNWRPWVAVVGLVGLTALPLSSIGFRLLAALALEQRTYRQYGVHYENGLPLGEEILLAAALWIGLVLWSWTSGFVLARLSGRTLWLTGPLFYFAVLDSFWVPVVISGEAILRGGGPGWIARLLLPNGAPEWVLVAAVATGVWRGLDRRSIRIGSAAVLAGVCVGIAVMDGWTGVWYRNAQLAWSGGVWSGARLSHVNVWPAALLSWPVAYVLAGALRRSGTAPFRGAQ